MIDIGGWTFDHVVYDREADVLYLSIGEPRPGVGDETPEGHILRFDEDGQLSGLTLMDVSEFATSGEPLVVTMPTRTSVPSRDLQCALLV